MGEHQCFETQPLFRNWFPAVEQRVEWKGGVGLLMLAIQEGEERSLN